MTTSVPAVEASARFKPPRVAPPWLRTLRWSLRSWHMRVGIAITLFILGLAILGPLFAPYSPTAFVGVPVSGPSSHFWFGTDEIGRDVLTRVLYGGRTVVWMSFASAVLGAALGVVVGLLAGYSPAWLDETLMRASDVILAFPQIVLGLMFVSLIGPKLWLIVLVVAVSHAPRVARLARGVGLEVIQREFIQAAEVIGLPRRRILFGEVLPNLMTPLMVEFGLRLVWSIGIIAGLSFLGFGLQPPTSDWGLMINENRTILIAQPWGVLAPVFCISAFAIGINLMTEGFARTVSGVSRSNI